MAFAGPLWGLMFGLVVYGWLRNTKVTTVEIMMLLGAVFSSFFTAELESISTSGVLAAVFLGHGERSRLQVLFS